MFPIEPADRSESSDSQPVRDTVGAISESRRMVGNRSGSLSTRLIPPTDDARKY